MSRFRIPTSLASLLAAGLLMLSAPGLGGAQAVRSDWIVVDYSELIDRRQLTHSGDSVGMLLDRLDGRSLPAAGERPADFHAHRLLEPLLEPYGFVLPDALDRSGPAPWPPWVEVGSLWQPGAVQPAWAELLRARRLLIESDGAGAFRAILPWSGEATGGALPRTDSRTAAGQAWDEAWPVVRHVLAAERRRLARGGAEPPAMSVEVHAYRHLPARSEFLLGAEAERRTVDDLRGVGLRPPLDLVGIEAFLEGELLLEGARLEPDGALRLFGSRVDASPTLLGRPLDAADLAVAYRAVFHGGLAEPYMSLDRGYSPTMSVVNYGGRLRDTALGSVSLLCDIRFKTFSLGIDIAEGRDLRARLRARLPGFRSHLERLAEDPDSGGMAGQQTRLWFYPDQVDLTLSEQGDVLVLRQVRMSAASERVSETGLAAEGEVRPWTRATIDAINRDYDALAGFFPEMADLDQVVRLLSLFAWLKSAEAEGQPVPELESFLALELPPLSTPRTYPQLLAFNALPPPGGKEPVIVYDRVPIGEALERLGGEGGRPLPARRRYQRAVGALDPSRAEHAALLGELERYDVEALDASELDLLAQRAERIRMHETVLGTLDPDRRGAVLARMQAGEQLRIFSVGIGGLDLGMGPVVKRARSRSAGLATDRPGPAREGEDALAATTAPREARAGWRRDPEGLPGIVMPPHGLAGSAGERAGVHRVERGVAAPFAPGGAPSSWVLTLYGADGPEVRSRRVFLDRADRAVRFERVEAGRRLDYRFEVAGGRLAARTTTIATAAPTALPTRGGELPPGLVLLEVGETGEETIESPGVTLRLRSRGGAAPRTFAAEFPRRVLQRLVLGREVDRTPGQPLAGLSPLPAALGEVDSLMVLPSPGYWQPPWEDERVPRAGEEEPVRLARALDAWWRAEPDEGPAAVVGVAPAVSPTRWRDAPRPGTDALLLLPGDGSERPDAGWRAALAEGWEAERVVERLPHDLRASLVVLVSDEPPSTFAMRLRELARDDRMRGRLLAAWCLSGPVREDVARSLLEEGRLAGLGLAEPSLVVRRSAKRSIEAMARRLSRAEAGNRVEQLPGPFLWYF